MARMYDRWPDDHELALFNALSLLGAVRPVDKGFRRQALAASIALKVMQENPKHPGAAHFVIHAFDDPDHAILALPAARAYAGIAPAAPHAAYAIAYLRPTRHVAGRGCVQHRGLQGCRGPDCARAPTGRARKRRSRQAAADRNPRNANLAEQYRMMLARYILDTGKWEKIPLEGAPGAHSDHEAMPGMPGMGAAYSDEVWIFIAGLSAAKPLAIMENEVASAVQLVRGQPSEAVRRATQAVDIDAALAAPSGPPYPIKPALEFLGEVLLDAGRPAEAATAFQQELLRTPKRTPSVEGLARAAREGRRSVDRREQVA